MINEKSYNRTHLRAPFKYDVLFEDEDFAFKARTVNISEGGMLFDMLPHFPDREKVAVLMALPQYPYFKNFSLGRIKDFSQEVFSKRPIRIKGKMVRREGATTSVDQVFMSRIGVKFTDIDVKSQRAISEYVNVFVSNIIFLQALLDNVNSDEVALLKARALSKVLGYEEEMKIALLRKQVTSDYRSLQWL